MAKLINLTPHALTLRDEQGRDHCVPPAGVVARVAATPGASGAIDGVPVPVMERTTYGAVEGLPEPLDGVFYVVSGIVVAALGGVRADVLCPGTGPRDGAVRDEQGRIVAVTRLIRA